MEPALSWGGEEEETIHKQKNHIFSSSKFYEDK